MYGVRPDKIRARELGKIAARVRYQIVKVYKAHGMKRVASRDQAKLTVNPA